jgi:hypothetical protein
LTEEAKRRRRLDFGPALPRRNPNRETARLSILTRADLNHYHFQFLTFIFTFTLNFTFTFTFYAHFTFTLPSLLQTEHVYGEKVALFSLCKWLPVCLFCFAKRHMASQSTLYIYDVIFLVLRLV